MPPDDDLDSAARGVLVCSADDDEEEEGDGEALVVSGLSAVGVGVRLGRGIGSCCSSEDFASWEMIWGVKVRRVETGATNSKVSGS